MLRSLRLYGLITVAVGLVWVNLRAPAINELVLPIDRAESVAQIATASSQPALLPRTSIGSLRMSSSQLPHTLTRPKLEVALRDPFVLKPPPVTVQVLTKPAAPPIAVQAVSPPPPVAPPLNLTFAGRMTAPDGRLVVYVANGAFTQAISVGQDLPNGYRVDTITAQAVG